MTYRGQIKNSVVVFDEVPDLADGTAVRIETEDIQQPARGNKQALLTWRSSWEGPDDELRTLLDQVQAMRDADLTSSGLC